MGASRYFGTTTDVFYLQRLSTTSIGTAMTCLTWFNTSGTSGTQAIVNCTPVQNFTELRTSGTTKPSIALTTVRTGTTNATPNSWHAIVGSGTATTQNVCYSAFQNDLVSENSGTGTLVNNGDYRIGAVTNNNQPFGGYIAIVQIYQVELTLQQKQEIMLNPFCGLFAGLLIFLPIFGTNSPEVDLSINRLTFTNTSTTESFLGPPVGVYSACNCTGS